MFSRTKTKFFKLILIPAILLGAAGSVFVPGNASAAGEIYTWSGNTIVGTAGAIETSVSVKRLTFSKQADNNYAAVQSFGTAGSKGGGSVCSSTYTISNFGPDGGSANVSTKSSTGAACGVQLSGTISIQGTAGQFNKATGDATAPDCEGAGEDIGFMLCPLINTVTGFADWIMEDVIQPLIRSEPVSLDPNSPIYRIWSSFRIYGNIILVIALIFVVFGQAIGGGVFEAYAARKMLPRILLTAVLINVSIYIVALGVDLSNIIGFAIGDLIITPVKDSAQFTFTPTGIQVAGAVVGGTVATGLLAGFVAALFLTGTVGTFLLWGLLFVLMPIILALLGAFVTIIFLHGIIFILVAVSPVAFALYCLPNTEKYFKTWWDWFFRALLIYPIVMIMFAIADVMSVAITQGNDLVGQPKPFLLQAPTNVAAGLIGLLVLFLPLALIPFAFKLAGGLLGRINDIVANYKSKTAETIKGNPNDPRSLRNRTRYRMGSAMDQARGVARDTVANASKVGTGRGRVRRGILRGVARALDYGDLEGRLAERNKAAREIITAQHGMGPDSSIRALWAEQQPDGRWLSPYEDVDPKTGVATRKEWSAADVARARSRAQKDPSLVQSMGEYEFGKAAEDGHIDKFKEAFARNANRLGWSDNVANGTWLGISFAQQGTRKEQKYTAMTRDGNGQLRFNNNRRSATGETLNYGDVNHYGFSREMADAVKQWDVAQFRPSTAKAAKEGYQEFSAIVGQLSSRQGQLSATEQAQLESARQVVQNYQDIAANMAQRFATGAGLPAGADLDNEPGARYQTGNGGSVRAEAAWKDFIQTVRPPTPGP